MYLTRVDGHAGWANRKALEAAGITASTPDPAGGRILRTSSGAPTGVLVDRAQGLVTSKIPPSHRRGPDPAASGAGGGGMRAARLTTVHDAGVGREETRRLPGSQTGRQAAHTHLRHGRRSRGALAAEYLKRGPETGERLTVRSIKLLADGALGSRGAALLQALHGRAGQLGLLDPEP